MLCTSEVIRQYDKVEVPNKSVPRGEYFYDVPIENWYVYDL